MVLGQQVKGGALCCCRIKYDQVWTSLLKEPKTTMGLGSSVSLPSNHWGGNGIGLVQGVVVYCVPGSPLVMYSLHRRFPFSHPSMAAAIAASGSVF